MDLNSAATLARNLMNLHGLNDWYFQFSRSTKNFGDTSYYKKIIRLSKIRTATRNEKEVTNTILHEIAHALRGWEPGMHHHDAKWRNIFISIGGDGLAKSKATDISKIEYLHKGYCKCNVNPGHGSARVNTKNAYRCTRCKATIVYRHGKNGYYFIRQGEYITYVNLLSTGYNVPKRTVSV